MNKTSNETSKITYYKSYVIIKSFNKKKYITGGEAIYKILKNKNLIEIYDLINKNRILKN